MSYRLVRLQWAKYENGSLVRRLFSYHMEEDQIAGFIREFKNRRKQSVRFRYHPEGRGEHRVSGRLYNKVCRSQYGLWGRQEKLFD